MKIELQSMRVVNCGPLKDVEIDFTDGKGKPRQTILLAGANGSGKTTILEVIFALAEILNPGYPDYEQRYGTLNYDEWHDIDSRRNRARDNLLLRAKYSQMDLQVDGKDFSVFWGDAPPDVKLASSNFGWRRGNLGIRLEDTESLAKKIWLGIEEQDSALPIESVESSARPAPSMLFLPHLRLIPAVQPEKITLEDIGYRWTYKYEPANRPEGSLDSYLVWLDYAYPERFPELIEFLNQLDFDGKTFSVRRKELKAVVTTRDGSEHYLEELSSGEQSILITLLELRLRLLPGSIVLIDEIEHSLHPAFQYRIAEGLKRMQEMIPFQLIATTHAPAFLDIFGAENTLILTEF